MSTSTIAQNLDDAFWGPLPEPAPKSAQEVERERFERSAAFYIRMAEQEVRHAVLAYGEETNAIALLEAQHDLDALADVVEQARAQAAVHVARLARKVAA